VPGIPVTHAVLWKDSAITDLKTLKDGYQSVALAVNNRGQVVGAADNGTTDSDAMFSDNYGWVTQTRAFLWQDDVMQDLGTLGGTDAVGLLINDRGQIVGASYTSSAPSAYCGANLGASLTTGAFLYEDGEMKNIGSFGGTCTFPTDLNNRGEIVGISTLPDDQYQHAFLWKDGSLHDLHNTIGGENAGAIQLNDAGDVVGWASPSTSLVPQRAALWKNGAMTDLGTVDGDECSNGYSINANDQVVGISAPCDFSHTRAFLWQDGSITDLNTLIPAGSPLYLTAPETINDRGEIAGVGVDANGNQHAFLLMPCDHDDTDCHDAGYPAFRPAPNITKRPGSQKGLRRMFRNGSRPISGVSSVSTPSAPDAVAPIGRPVANEAVNETGSSGPIFSESLEADLMSRSETAPKCGHYGMPCYEPKVYIGCCAGLKCLVHGGSDRVGYACE
jgi:probable HAF family extracellular repeat protein